jgi:hypothetical protein
MCAVVRLRALMARQAARLITNSPIQRNVSCNIVLEHMGHPVGLYIVQGYHVSKNAYKNEICLHVSVFTSFIWTVND